MTSLGSALVIAEIVSVRSQRFSPKMTISQTSRIGNGWPKEAKRFPYDLLAPGGARYARRQGMAFAGALTDSHCAT